MCFLCGPQFTVPLHNLGGFLGPGSIVSFSVDLSRAVDPNNLPTLIFNQPFQLSTEELLGGSHGINSTQVSVTFLEPVYAPGSTETSDYHRAYLRFAKGALAGSVARSVRSSQTNHSRRTMCRAAVAGFDF
jgi:hypothetical protein